MPVETVLNTRRLILRPLALDDVEILQQLGSDADFQLIPDIATPFDAAAWVRHKIENEDPAVSHVITLRGSAEVIGYCQIQGEAGEKSYEFSVGYWLGKAYWGQGYATKTLEVLIKFAVARFQPWPIRASVHRLNEASKRVLEKCDFVLVEPVDDDQDVMLLYRWNRPNSAA